MTITTMGAPPADEPLDAVIARMETAMAKDAGVGTKAAAYWNADVQRLIGAARRVAAPVEGAAGELWIVTTSGDGEGTTLLSGYEAVVHHYATHCINCDPTQADIAEARKFLLATDEWEDVGGRPWRLRSSFEDGAWCCERVTENRTRAADMITTLSARLADAERERDEAVKALGRCRNVLGNMAKENEGAIFWRWPIHHEPLRADARGLLPIIDEALDRLSAAPATHATDAERLRDDLRAIVDNAIAVWDPGPWVTDYAVKSILALPAIARAVAAPVEGKSAEPLAKRPHAYLVVYEGGKTFVTEDEGLAYIVSASDASDLTATYFGLYLRHSSAQLVEQLRNRTDPATTEPSHD